MFFSGSLSQVVGSLSSVIQSFLSSKMERVEKEEDCASLLTPNMMQ